MMFVGKAAQVIANYKNFVLLRTEDWHPVMHALNRQLNHDKVNIKSTIGRLDLFARAITALDTVVNRFDFDYLMALETDVMTIGPNWLQWFLDQMRDTDYAVGMWHHEQFVNPSCTLYRGDVLRRMQRWCWDKAPQDKLRWGDKFMDRAPLDNNLPLTENPAAALQNIQDWIAGPFAEKRGWPTGTVLKEQPSGQMKGPGWYEPGQQLHHWAVEEGYTYTVCPSLTTFRHDHMPLQSVYGRWGQEELRKTYPPSCRLGVGEHGYDHQRQLEAVELFGNGQTVHLWGGTRALDILKHPVTCQFVKANTPQWLAREARFWKHVVPADIQAQTLELIQRHGWHITGQGSDHVSDRDREAAEYVKQCYEAGGVTW
jgi:hypothetical protein